MPGRSFTAANTEGYRYSFNGKEDDTEWAKQDYGFRIYDKRIGKFLSVDPLTRKYAWYTPYQFSGNMPICAIDLDGAEELRVTAGVEKMFDTELEILRKDEVIGSSFKAIQNPDLSDKHLVIFKLGETNQAATHVAFTPSLESKNYIEYYTKYPEMINEKVTEAMGKLLQPLVDAGLTQEQAKQEVIKGRTVHVVTFNPQESLTSLDWSLNDFVHEIELHLQNNINGLKRTVSHEDHKKAHDYEKLTPDQKAKIDAGQSLDPLIAPEGSQVRKIQEKINERIKTKGYKKDTSDEKNKSRIKDIKDIKAKG